MINIVVPMAGRGKSFEQAGYAFPKPLVDINGKTMIELVTGNLRPQKYDHRFIFVCLREQYEQFDFYNIFQKATDNKFEVVLLGGPTEGAACTVLAAAQYIANNDALIIANADQYIDYSMDTFISNAESRAADGFILTFHASHPKWSYARVDEKTNQVLETAEKKVISEHATAGIYYFKHGSDYTNGAQAMIHKNIRFNNEFYVCPVYNELILKDKKVFIDEIPSEKVHGLGTPEDVRNFLQAK